MRIRTKRRNGRNPLVVVYFEEDSNFNPEDLSWAPTLKEVSRIYRALKRVDAWRKNARATPPNS